MTTKLTFNKFASALAALGATSLGSSAAVTAPISASETTAYSSPATNGTTLGDKDEDKKKKKSDGDEGGCGAGSCGS